MFALDREFQLLGTPLPAAIANQAAPQQPAAVAQSLPDGPGQGPLLSASVAASSAFAVFLLAYFYPLLKFAGTQALLLVPGYAKLHREALLEHRVRAELVARIRADPGASPAELFRLVKAGWTTIVYHLHVLEKNQVVRSVVDGRHRRFFPAADVPPGRRAALAVLRNARTRQMLDLLADQPGLDRTELAKRMGFSVPAAVWHIERLERVSLIGRDRVGRALRYYPLDVPVSPHEPTDVA